ncbi:MAG: hypothetical protein ACJ8EL_01585 [Rhizomicrobium sp.]|jgi:hypothetical protein
MMRRGPNAQLEFATAFSGRPSPEHAHLRDLIEILLLHPAGLRRWSVMRAIRTRCQRSGAEISLKLEDEVERLFRRFCSEESAANDSCASSSSESPLFYRPQERAGEVWAVNAVRGRAWLAGTGEEMASAR